MVKVVSLNGCWYFSNNGKLTGPMSFSEVALLVHHARLREKYLRLGLNPKQIDFRLRQFDSRWNRKVAKEAEMFKAAG